MSMKKTKYGAFSADGTEFILEEPVLARPWMNVLTNGLWCDVCSHLGGGYSFIANPTVGRITRWHIDGIPRETVGKFLYIKDEESGKYWLANGNAAAGRLDKWKCHIGLGYNRIESENDGIACSMTYFTPMPDAEKSTGSDTGDPCLLWLVKLTNTSKKERNISATAYVEFALGNWFEDTSWREFYLLFNRQEYHNNAIYTRSMQWVKYLGGWQAANSEGNNIPFAYAAFLASSAKVSSYEGEREEFIGSYHSLANPKALEQNALRNKLAEGRDACAALRHNFSLEPGDSKEFVLMLGAIDRNEKEAIELKKKYGSAAKAKIALENTKAYWKRVVSTPTIETPDKDLDNMVNIWFKYQGSILSWWNRNTGYCYFGIYNFGIRDACQDAVSRLPQDPAWVREHIVKRIMIWQFEGGDYAHGGNFLSMQGTRTFHSDDPLNPLFILGHYVRETGDFSILDEITPYAHTDGKKTDTIYAHAVKGIEFFWSQFSKRGLPLILKADWNDALDQMGNQRKGESVMNAGWAVICIELFYICMEYKKDFKRLKKWKAKVEELKGKVNKLCWDGNWYWRATHDSGWITGSHKNTNGGMIYANPNSFAIIAGIANEERTEKILASFDKYLDTPRGSRCFYPPFPEPDPKVGIISRFAPGTKENGSLQGHNSRWRIWAECVAGRADKAYQILRSMLPCVRHAEEPDIYRIEPYVACQFIYADEADRPGEGSHAWATGTACWTLLNVWQHLFGVQPEIEGLKISPCLPSEWTKVKMSRFFRGASYDIEIRKPKGITRGKIKIFLDGKELPSNIIPPQNDGKTHSVIVEIS